MEIQARKAGKGKQRDGRDEGDGSRGRSAEGRGQTTDDDFPVSYQLGAKLAVSTTSTISTVSTI